eukprot:scaffold148_cov371-Prasinococcus_capsulatus_cf.AAC.8
MAGPNGRPTAAERPNPGAGGGLRIGFPRRVGGGLRLRARAASFGGRAPPRGRVWIRGQCGRPLLGGGRCARRGAASRCVASRGGARGRLHRTHGEAEMCPASVGGCDTASLHGMVARGWRQRGVRRVRCRTWYLAHKWECGSVAYSEGVRKCRECLLDTTV